MKNLEINNYLDKHVSVNPISEAYLMDCMVFMKQTPDNFFDICLADPPYGIKEDGLKNHSRSKLAKAQEYTPKDWDKQAMPKVFFDEIIRVSKNQIIWGANHFISQIPYDSPCWIVWDKDNGNNDFADCELAWTSFKTAVRRFKYRWAGMLQENMKNKERRIHPTQKPIDLLRYLVLTYTNEGDTVLDNCSGSGTTAIACIKEKRHFICFEKDETYWKKSVERVKNEQRQLTLW